MAPSPSADAALTAQDAGLLLDIADAAIVEGLFGGPPSVPPLALLPAALRQQILALKVSEASKPIAFPGGIGVVMVCQRADPPSPVPTTDQVYDQIMHQRMDQMARRYLRDLRRSAFVDIRG